MNLNPLTMNLVLTLTLNLNPVLAQEIEKIKIKIKSKKHCLAVAQLRLSGPPSHNAGLPNISRR
jgi:hypothetical protein